MFEPRLRAGHVPAGWTTREELTLLAPDRRSNLIASSEPIPANLTTEQYANVQGESMPMEFPGYDPLSFERTELLDGRDCWIREFRWKPPDLEESVHQLQMYYVEEGRGYTATVTAPSSHFISAESELLEILKGLRLAPVRQETGPTP